MMANPALAKGSNGRPIEHSAASGDDTCACGRSPRQMRLPG